MEYRIRPKRIRWYGFYSILGTLEAMPALGYGSLDMLVTRVFGDVCIRLQDRGTLVAASVKVGAGFLEFGRGVDATTLITYDLHRYGIAPFMKILSMATGALALTSRWRHVQCACTPAAQYYARRPLALTSSQCVVGRA